MVEEVNLMVKDMNDFASEMKSKGSSHRSEATDESSGNNGANDKASPALVPADSLPATADIPLPTIFVQKSPPDAQFRAVHKIRMSALVHNFAVVEAAASRQRCSVIVVVKANGYGHGAIDTALHLADNVGADAFAVATLEEGIALRKAFLSTNPHTTNNGAKLPNQTIKSSFSRSLAGAGAPTQQANTNVTKLFESPDSDTSTVQQKEIQSVTSKSVAQAVSVSATEFTSNAARRPNMRSSQIRILVLGPPVGFPRCFDDYYHYGIEVMVSGPEVASALLTWVVDTDERKRTQVERAATEAKESVMLKEIKTFPVQPTSRAVVNRASDLSDDSSVSDASNKQSEAANRKLQSAPYATLSNTSGEGLAKELRTILLNQQAAAAAIMNDSNRQNIPPSSSASTAITTTTVSTTTVTASTTACNEPVPPAGLSNGMPTVPNQTKQVGAAPQVFGGIEAAAKHSRTKHKAATQAVFQEDSSDGDSTEFLPSSNDKAVATAAVAAARTSIKSATSSSTFMSVQKRLRWHALVDSGMGRLGFRTDPLAKHEVGHRPDTVPILKELVDLEVTAKDCPIEFFGLCTHMADASSTSDYTNSQINKFKSLLKRVRLAGISVPTVSTDNSSALLTTNLTHFDPKEILSQDHVDTRGYVRTGGAIYGQRPAFPQLRAVSTLMAAVRHVAVVKKGDSVGYDRAYVASRTVKIATLAIGFADGYPRELGNGVGMVAIRGHTFPVAGNICMDMMMVDLGPVDDPAGSKVVVGDTAILWGPDDDEMDEGLVRLQDIAATLKTTQSALTCGLDKVRVLRQLS